MTGQVTYPKSLGFLICIVLTVQLHNLCARFAFYCLAYGRGLTEAGFLTVFPVMQGVVPRFADD